MVTQFDEDHAAISPDGKYVAYEGSETGRAEIYVRTYPDLDGGKWQISTDGGNEPLWGPDGSELFFRDNETGWISMVDIERDSSSFASSPRVIVRGDYYNNSPSYDISPDGTHFLMFKNEDESGTTEEVVAERAKLAVVENWFEELKRITPTETSQ
jgi:Tol biopolymer transport system component